MADINFPDRGSYDQIICPYCWVNTWEEHMKYVEGVGMVCNQCIKAKGLTPKSYEPKEFKCDSCEFKTGYTTGDDEYPARTHIIYCAKWHWENSMESEHSVEEADPWRDCPDYQQKDETKP